MKKSMIRRLSIFTLAIITTGLISGCVDRKAQAESKQTEKFLSIPTVSVTVTPASSQTVSKEVAITGNLATSNISQVGAREAGRIVAIYVRDGDLVKAGQVLAIEDKTQLRASYEQALGQVAVAQAAVSQALWNQRYQPIKTRAALDQAKSQVASAQASLKKELAGARIEARKQAQATLAAAKTNLQVAQADLKRQETLFDQGAIPQNQLDSARNTAAIAQQQYDNAFQNMVEIRHGNRPEDIAVARQAVIQAEQMVKSAEATQNLNVLLGDQVTSAKAELASAQAEVSLAQSNLNDATVRAPFSGQVAGQPVQLGTVVSVGTPILQVVSTQGTYFDGQIPEQFISSIKVGAPVDVTIDALPGVHFSGHVSAINPLGVQYGRLFSVRIAIDTTSTELKPNMFATGKVQTAIIPDATVVPVDAVLSDNAERYLFTVQNGIAKKLTVKTGITSGNNVQVMGLAPGTPVVIQGQQNLLDGTKVKVLSGAN